MEPPDHDRLRRAVPVRRLPLATLGPVRPRRLQHRLLRQPGTRVLAAPPRRAGQGGRHGGLPHRRQDVPVLRTDAVDRPHAVRPVRALGRRTAGGPLAGARVRRPVHRRLPPGAGGAPHGDRDAAGPRRLARSLARRRFRCRRCLLAGTVPHRLGQRVPRDRAVGSGVHHRCGGAHVGAVARAVSAPRGAGHRVRVRRGAHAGHRGHRRRRRTRAGGIDVLAPRSTSIDHAVGRRVRRARHAHGDQPRQVRHAARSARRPSGADVAVAVTRGLVRRQRRELLRDALPHHHGVAVPATGRGASGAAAAGRALRSGSARAGQLPVGEQHTGLVADGVGDVPVRPRGDRSGRAAAPPAVGVGGGAGRCGGRGRAVVPHRLHRQPLPRRHAADADGARGDRRARAARSVAAADAPAGRGRCRCVGRLGHADQRRAGDVEPEPEGPRLHGVAVPGGRCPLRQPGTEPDHVAARGTRSPRRHRRSRRCGRRHLCRRVHRRAARLGGARARAHPPRHRRIRTPGRSGAARQRGVEGDDRARRVDAWGPPGSRRGRSGSIEPDHHTGRVERSAGPRRRRRRSDHGRVRDPHQRHAGMVQLRGDRPRCGGVRAGLRARRARSDAAVRRTASAPVAQVPL